MPGTGGFGWEKTAGFYPYLRVDLLVVMGLVGALIGARQILDHLQLRLEPGSERLGPSPSTPRARLPAPGPRLPLDDRPPPPGPAGDARGFAQIIIQPVAIGQPWWLANVLQWESHFWLAHPMDLAVATVLVQTGIGVMILIAGDARLGWMGLWASIAGGLFVWFGGEAMGGVPTLGRPR